MVMPSLSLCTLPLLTLLSLTTYVFGEEVKITTVNDLIGFSNKVSSGTSYAGTTIYLENDIDFSGLSNQFKPIGDESNTFLGVFDGQGHKISNLALNSGSYRHAGLFGYSQGGTTIRNLVLDSTCSFSSSCATQNGKNAFIGGIIGGCDAIDRSCISENNVNMAGVSFVGSSSKNLFMGGIVGQFWPDGNNEIIIRNCINYGSVTYTGRTFQYTHIGGIVGELSHSDTSAKTKRIQNCINYGQITCSGSNGDGNRPYVGGIVGVSNSPIKIENCVNVGAISIGQGLNSVCTGNIVGFVYMNTEMANCYWVAGTGYGGLFGYNDPSATAITTDSRQITINADSVSALNSYGSFNKWVLNTNSASVTFHTNKGNGYKFTSQLILLPSLVGSSGRTFSGWYTDITCTNKFDENSAVISINSGVNLYGGWKYTVNFNGNGGSSSQPTKDVVYGQNYGSLGSATKTGYNFAGWFTASSGGTEIKSNTKVEITSAQTLFAHWTAIQSAVTFNGNGGTPSKAQTTVTYESTYGDLPEAERTGYSFLGWFTAANGGEQVRKDDTVKITSAQTLFAHWTAIQYTVTFNGNGGNPTETQATVIYDKTYGDLPDAERTGYSFLGWFTDISDGEVIEGTTKVIITSAQTLFAHWEANTYDVSFDGNGGVLSSQDPKNVTYDEPYGDLPDVTRVGHTFLGWFTNITEGDKVESDTNVTIAEDHTLYAQWEANTYTVAFKIDNKTVIEEELQFNTTIAYPNIPEREGFMFAGWDNNISTVPDHNITINALWDEVSEFVEIVFSTKEMTKKDIEKIIEQYAESGFTIVEFVDQPGEEIRVVVKFNDKKVAENFVETVKAEPSVKTSGFISGDIYSYSLVNYPVLIHILFSL